MASIIPAYEYDIFISYRQKDNKYDGWVTEFVEHLKNELEATFKEDVSIYFDENPHDGLLEIYNVDKSLELKLKSLVFIPIISQTYCDPKSFAWQNEFVVFNRMASADPLGKDVKLTSGNICSRIIPVKIHELDTSDIELFEKEVGNRLRSIEFIYESAGVNRPLKPSDNPDKNLNKTFYRDQINKVANAVKDVIYGLHPDPKKRAAKSYQTRGTLDYTGNQRTDVPSKTFLSKKVLKATVLLASVGIILILAVLFIYPKHKGKSKAGLMYPETVIVNESLARQLYGDRSPLGRHLSFQDKYKAAGALEIVGVVKDVRGSEIRKADRLGTVYIPSWSNGAEARWMEVRFAGDVAPVIAAIRRELRNMDPNVPLLRSRLLREYVDGMLSRERLIAWLAGFFGLLAVALAGVGLYGVVAYAATQRTKEIGIRMALGARAGDVVRMIVGDSLVPVLAGVAAGLGGAMALARLVAGLLYGVAPRDPLSMALAAGGLFAVALIAAAIPARRASRADPVKALHYE